MPSFKCKDLGMKDDFEVKTPNADELMPIIAIHAEKSHGMKDVPRICWKKSRRQSRSKLDKVNYE